jgi:eukaryotic-like serine/threonine-protein kinase
MRIARISVSSPDDASLERRRTERVAQRLNGAFAGVARIETVRWETSYYATARGFQEQFPAPGARDMVVAVLKIKRSDRDYSVGVPF